MPEEAVAASELPRVLVVEDEAVVAIEIERRLAGLGYAVCGRADSGEAGLVLARTQSPDVVLMDIVLTGVIDGVDAAARIREELAVPVVFLTADSDPATLRRAGAAGPAGYVIKPFEDRELAVALDIALYKSRMERRLRENERWKAVTLQHLGEGVVATDPRGRVRFANPMAEALLGLSVRDMLGCELAGLYRTQDNPDLLTDVDRTERREITLLCRQDGGLVPVEQIRSPLVDEQGQALGAVLVFRDISWRLEAERALRESVAGLRSALKQTVNALAVTSETRDPFSAGHQERVSRLAGVLAGKLGLSEEEQEGVRMAGLVHDIGKIHVPSEVLAKPQRLSAMEMGIVQEHSTVGHAILQGIPFPWPVARMVLEHHERCDGSGYPAGLTRDAVLPGSRILAVADVVEAMTAHRPYRTAWDLETALEHLAAGRDTLFDPDVVDACLALFSREGFRL
jgi:PAS domain S-box-containing protein/putative nucleotidyltransferase with HDIG domain